MNANQIERKPTPLESVMELVVARDFALHHYQSRVLVMNNMHRQNYHLQGFPMKIDESVFLMGLSPNEREREAELPPTPSDSHRVYPENELAEVVHTRLREYASQPAALKDFREAGARQMTDKGEALKNLIYAVVMLIKQEDAIVTVEQVLRPDALRMGHADTRIDVRWSRSVYQHFMALADAAKARAEAEAKVDRSMASMVEFADKMAALKTCSDPQVDHAAGLPVSVLEDMPTPANPCELTPEMLAVAAVPDAVINTILKLSERGTPVATQLSDAALERIKEMVPAHYRPIGDDTAPIAMGHPYAPYPRSIRQIHGTPVTLNPDGSLEFYPV